MCKQTESILQWPAKDGTNAHFIVDFRFLVENRKFNYDKQRGALDTIQFYQFRLLLKLILFLVRSERWKKRASINSVSRFIVSAEWS